jgi:SAM-dependent methyltransferase
VFNGRKLISVAAGDEFAPASQVEEAFSFLGDVEFLHHPNDPGLWEMSTFWEKLERLSSTNPDEATFYAHTKGVRRAPSDVSTAMPLDTLGASRMRGVQQWRDRMYHECLNVEHVDRALQEAACAGCFRISNYTPPPLKGVPWFFAGTFYWLNHAKTFSRDWRQDLSRYKQYGCEVFPGMLFDLDESYCLAVDNPSVPSLYGGERMQFHCPCGWSGVLHVRTEGESKPCRACWKMTAMQMWRWDVINRLLPSSDADYLEIGLGAKGRCFPHITADRKVSVDPVETDATYCVTSDDYFENHVDRLFDVVFVDGVHHKENAYRDIVNALKVLKPGGAVVVHDCSPETELAQRVPRQTTIWNGDVWRAWAELRRRDDLLMEVVDIDYGCGVIKKGTQEPYTGPAESWDDLEANRVELLSLVPWAEWRV